MNLEDLDIAALRTFLSLLKTNSTTESARQLGRSQPAISQTLAKLRARFDDPLFIVERKRLVATPKAQALAPPIEAALSVLDGVVGTQPPASSFDPSKMNRSFIIACPDYLRDALLSRLKPLFDQAPGAQVQFETTKADCFERLARQELTLLVTARSVEPALVSEIESTPATPLSWAVFSRANHPFARNLSLEAWKSAHHVQVIDGNATRALDDYLYSARLSRRVSVRVPDFFSALATVVQSDFLFTAPAAPLSNQAERLGLWVMPNPLPLPDIQLSYHLSRRAMTRAADAWVANLIMSNGLTSASP